MDERDRLLASIAKTIVDYRVDEIANPSTSHINKWACQFKGEVQLPILREMDFVLQKTYISRRRVTKFLINAIFHRKMVGDCPKAFWMGANVLEIQQRGLSQSDMLNMLNASLNEEVGIVLDTRDTKSFEYIYLDDVIFTGNRIRQDLNRWIVEEAPAFANVHVIAMAIATYGKFDANRKILAEAKRVGKRINLKWYPELAIQIEDRLKYRDTSDVLWPTSVPPEICVDPQCDLVLRNPGHAGKRSFFTGDQGRQLLEQQFLIAGQLIRSAYFTLQGKQDVTMRPLGKIGFENRLGFGSLVVTFRNCPNNAPLALWADIDSQDVGSWYPLFRRKSNRDTQYFENF